MSYTTTATATNSTGNTILVASTINLFSGLPIVFSGTVFGGITSGASYYVGNVDYENNLITVSSLPGGTAFILTTATGSMTATFDQGGQQIIDTTPPGVPLNTAFNDTNLNFDQIFAAGPVGSNIQIKNNIISSVNTNGNISLKPNGVGTVVANSHLLPDVNRVRNLGSPSSYWNTIYAWYGNIQNAQIAGGNISIGVANLHISGGTNGYVLQTDGDGNLTWTAQTGGGGNGTPGGANSQIQFNDAGVFGGHPNFTFNKFTDLLTVPGNIYPFGNAIQSLGNATHQWKSLWVSGNTIYINSVPISLTAGNILTVNGADVVTTTANGVTSLGNIGFVGDAIYDLNGIIVENADLTHGATAALILPSNGNTTVPISLNNTYGNITLGTGPSSAITNTWKFGADGKLTLPGQLVAKATDDYDAIQFSDNGTNDNGSIKVDGGSNMVVKAQNNFYVKRVGSDRLAITDTNSDFMATANVTIQSNKGGSAYTWTFGLDGNLTLPTNTSSINYANGVPYGGGGGGGNTFASITMTSTPAGAANNIQYGLGNLVSYLDGGWTIGEYNGNSFGTEGIRINPAIEGFADIVLPSQTDAAVNPVSVNNYAGNVSIQSAGGTWYFNNQGNLVLPPNRRITTESGQITILPATDMYIQAGSGIVPGAGGSAVDIRSGSGQDGNSNNDGGYGGTVRFIGGGGGGANGSGTNAGIGGEIYMRAGDGGQADVGNSVPAATGGATSLYGGPGGYAFDNSELAARGGDVFVRGGDGTYNENTETRDGLGGNVFISGGNFGQTGAASGNVSIQGWTGSYPLNWTFDNTGVLTTPSGGRIAYAGMGWLGIDNGNTGTPISINSYVAGDIGNINSSVFLTNDFINLVVVDQATATTNTWAFSNDGNLTTPEGTGDITMSGGNISNVGTIQVANNYPTLLAYGSGGHGGPELDYCDGDDPADIFENPSVYRNVLYLNGGGLYVGTNENGNANVAGGAGYNWQFTPTGNTILPLLNTQRGDNPSGTIYGYTLNIGDGNHEAIISTPDGDANIQSASQRLVINPGKGADGTSGEGGDIYLWAGRGGTGDGTTGGGSGGDIKIRGGQGMAQNAGGYIRIEAGDSHNDTGQAGFIEITAGATTGGQTGYVNITGGANGNGQGGPVTLAGGYGTVSYGNVAIHSNTNHWTFDNTGALTLPQIYTGPGPSEQLTIRGTRDIVGTIGNWSAQISGSTPTVVYTCTSNAVESAKLTFVVQSNNATFGWEQFDVAVIRLYAGGVGVTVSNRMNNNPANGDTQVTADINGDSNAIEIYLAQPGSGTAYVNYTATEFGLMAD